MGPLPINVLNAISDFGDSAADIFASGFYLVTVFLGGLALWTGFILARWVLNGCTFRRRGGRH